MTIPLTNLKRQYSDIKNEVEPAVVKVLQNADFILGEEVSEFEKKFAKYIGTKYCIGTSSGESAILLILKSLGVGPGDEVITVPNTFIATAFPILTLGAKPVFIEVDPKTYQMDTKKLEEAVTKKTKVILPVHLFGIPAPIHEILAIAKKHGIFVVEDACQAHGSSINGKKCGSFGIASAFSFYPGKNLGAAGDAGAITTNDDELAKNLRAMRNIGQFEKYKHDIYGYNFRLDTIQAAYLGKKLRHLDAWNRKRRGIADLYRKLLSDLPVVLPPKLDKSNYENYHVFAVRTKERDDLLAYLKKMGIGAAIHYPIPLHLQKVLEGLGYKEGDFPIAEEYAKNLLSLPIFPEMTKTEVKKVSGAMHKFFEDKNRIKKIVVTGGAGLIGSTVIDLLIRENGKRIEQIVVLDNLVRGKKENLKDAFKSGKVKFVKGDIRDKDLIDKIIDGADYVIHEAAIKNFLCDEDPRLALEVLVEGTFNVMEACVRHNVKKLVFNSSASVYGQPLSIPMRETDNYNNDAFYGAGKIANEQMAKAFRKTKGLNYVCLRPFNVYGPRMDVSGLYTEVFIRWLDAIDAGKPPVIFGDGKNTLDFVYIEDVARATVLALLSPINEGFYNVASGKETDLNEVVKTLLELTKSKLKPEWTKEVRRSNYVTRRRGFVEKAKKDLGFVAKTTLREGIKKLIEWRKGKK